MPCEICVFSSSKSSLATMSFFVGQKSPGHYVVFSETSRDLFKNDGFWGGTPPLLKDVLFYNWVFSVIGGTLVVQWRCGSSVA